MSWTFLRGGSFRAAFAVAVAFSVVTPATVQAVSADPPVSLSGSQVSALSPRDRVADETPERLISVQFSLQLRIAVNWTTSSDVCPRPAHRHIGAT